MLAVILFPSLLEWNCFVCCSLCPVLLACNKTPWYTQKSKKDPGSILYALCCSVATYSNKASEGCQCKRYLILVVHWWSVSQDTAYENLKTWLPMINTHRGGQGYFHDAVMDHFWCPWIVMATSPPPSSRPFRLLWPGLKRKNWLATPLINQLCYIFVLY